MSGELSEIDKYCKIFRALELVKSGAYSKNESQNILPDEISLALEFIDRHFFEDITVADVARAAFVSESTFTRKFKQYLDLKPSEYIRKKRLTMAAGLLRNGNSVIKTGFDVGFKDNSNFIKNFRKHFGVTPFVYKKENSNL